MHNLFEVMNIDKKISIHDSRRKRQKLLVNKKETFQFNSNDASVPPVVNLYKLYIAIYNSLFLKFSPLIFDILTRYPLWQGYICRNILYCMFVWITSKKTWHTCILTYIDLYWVYNLSIYTGCQLKKERSTIANGSGFWVSPKFVFLYFEVDIFSTRFQFFIIYRGGHRGINFRFSK